MRGISNLIVVGIILLALFAGSVVFIPQIGQSLISIVTGPKECSITPYDYRCICYDGFDKAPDYPPDFGKYKCIPEVVPGSYSFPIEFTSLDDTSWRSKVRAYAEDFIKENYPNCNSWSCPQPAFISYGYYAPQQGLDGYAALECYDENGGNYWSITFSLVDGTAHPYIQSYCQSS